MSTRGAIAFSGHWPCTASVHTPWIEWVERNSMRDTSKAGCAAPQAGGAEALALACAPTRDKGGSYVVASSHVVAACGCRLPLLASAWPRLAPRSLGFLACPRALVSLCSKSTTSMGSSGGTEARSVGERTWTVPSVCDMSDSPPSESSFRGRQRRALLSGCGCWGLCAFEQPHRGHWMAVAAGLALQRSHCLSCAARLHPSHAPQRAASCCKWAAAAARRILDEVAALALEAAAAAWCWC